MPRPDIWYRRFYVHPIQRKYFDDLHETLRPYKLEPSR
jgi:hypothetical protein